MALKDEELMQIIVTADNAAFIDGVAPKGRVFPVIQSVMRQLGHESYQFAGVNENPLVKRIEELHSSMYRSKDLAIGGVHGGVYMFRDVFIQISVPLIYGTVELDILRLTDMSDMQKRLLAMNPAFFNQFADQFIDIFDFGAGFEGFDEARHLEERLLPKFGLAKYQLQAAAATLCSPFEFQGAVQSGLLAAELTVKAGLSGAGYTDQQLKKLNHDMSNCVNAFCEVYDGADFERMARVSGSLPKFVENRYSSEQPGRVETGEIVMKAQYIAGEVMRQLSGWSLRQRLDGVSERSYP
ncbi:hypothetical protein [Thalassospira lucentensis]|uniref:hypothetical protein n=1 Tax=Thalassospira lucentensis TaxID=168935 RepID=UPI003D2C6C89